MMKVNTCLGITVIILLSNVMACGLLNPANLTASGNKEAYPKASEDANIVYQLQSNKPRTHFFIDGKEMGVARHLKVYINNQAHTITAQAEGCIGKEEYVQPPYNSIAPLGFTYLMGECEGSIAVETAAGIPSGPAKAVATSNVVTQINIGDNKRKDNVVVTNNTAANEPANLTSGDFGRYFALVIGNNEYQFVPKLNTAENDAKEVAQVLEKYYGFNTTILLNAKRKDILDAINDFKIKLNTNDNLVIYYAGHGVKDVSAYWLPVDAKENSTTEWIQAETITTELKKINSKHVLIISDSCYSGELSRNITPTYKQGSRDFYLKKLFSKKSRTLIASGGNEPVADAGGGNHSIFTRAFIEALKNTPDTIFTDDELFNKNIKEIVAGNAEQTPQYSALRNSGHEDGSFIFVKKK